MTLVLGFADAHLGAGNRLQDQADVLDRIADVAIERGVDLIVNAGDTFNGPTLLPEQLAVFASFVARCHAAGIPIVAITGNGSHDLAMRDTNAVDIFRHIPGITVSSRPEVVEVAGCAIVTLPWVHPGRLVAAHGGGDRDEVNAEAAGLLIATARGLRAQIPEDVPAVLVGHWSVSGAALPNGLPVADLREPVLDLDALIDLDFDAILLGHIHLGAVLCEDPWIGYMGSPLPLNHGEGHYDHGVFVLELAA